MKVNKITQIISVTLLIVFSTLTFCLNFSFMSKDKLQEQTLAVIMKKEEETIKNIAFFNTTTKIGNISNKTQFDEFRNHVNGTGGKTATTFTGYTINLLIDIDFNSETNYTPIGTRIKNSDGTYTAHYFKGTFNGNGHTLKNIKMESDDATVCGDTGIFGYLNNATIKKLTVVIGSMYQTLKNKSVGGIVGYSYGKLNIEDCIIMPKNGESFIKASSNENADTHVGGIGGYLDGSVTIKRCASFVNLINDSTNGAHVGGIVGRFDSTDCSANISECYSNSNLQAGTEDTVSTYVGGIIGRSDTSNLTISNCLNNSNILAVSDYTYNYGEDPKTGTLRTADSVTVSYAKNNDWSNKEYNIKAGGICGYTTGGTISKCVSLKNSISCDEYELGDEGYNNAVMQNEYKNFIDFFYGRLDNVKDLTNDYTWYGDYVDIYCYQTILNYREISHGGTLSGCYAPSIGYYYLKDTKYNVKDVVFRGTVNKRDGNYYTFSAVPLEDLLKDPDKEKVYVSSTSYTSGKSFTHNGTTYNYKNVYYKNFYKYIEKLTYYKLVNNTLYTYTFDISNDWYDCDVAITYENQLSFNSLGTPNLTSFGQNENYLINGEAPSGNEVKYRVEDSTGYRGFYTYFTSYFNSHFVSTNNNTSNRKRYTNDGKSVIKDCYLKDVADEKIDYIFMYDYDYRYYDGLFSGYKWDTTNASQHSICTVTNYGWDSESRPSSAEQYPITDSINWQNVINTLGNSVWTSLSSGVTLKWLRWKDNYIVPGS